MKKLEVIIARHVKWKSSLGIYKPRRRGKKYKWYVPKVFRRRIQVGDMVLVSAELDGVMRRKKVVVLEVLIEEIPGDNPYKPVIGVSKNSEVKESEEPAEQENE